MGVHRKLTAIAPRQAVFEEVAERPLGPGEARVRSRLTTTSHGTGLSRYRGTAPFADQRFDLERRAFLPADGGTIFPMILGSEFVGEVVELAGDVDGIAVGDVVYGNGGHADFQHVRAASLTPLPAGLAPESALFVHHGCVALNAVHDAGILIGDAVGVVGLGAIGLLTVQLSRLAGATRVFAADPIAARRALATRGGAEAALDSSACDAGLEMKQLTGAGVDVAIDASGVYPGLQAAIRSGRIGARIVAAGYYQGGGDALRLGEEFLHNRVEIVSTMYVWECPHRAYPRWDIGRLRATVFGLLASGALDTEGYVTHRIPWPHADEAYRLLDERPEETVRVVVTYA